MSYDLFIVSLVVILASVVITAVATISYNKGRKDGIKSIADLFH